MAKLLVARRGDPVRIEGVSFNRYSGTRHALRPETALALAVGVEDRAAGVGDEVDRVSDAAPLELVPVALLGQILLVAPATTLALSCGTVSSLITAPIACGAKMSTSWP